MMNPHAPSIQLESEENKLLKAAEGYKGLPNIRQQLISEAYADGLSGPDAQAVVDQVLKRLNATENGQRGNALGVPHKAEDRHAAIKKSLKAVLF